MHDKLNSLSLAAADSGCWSVCVCDLYLSLNVSCESDSNMMFPTRNGGTHTQSATSTWLFAAAIGCSQSFPYPQHRQCQ